MADLSIDDLRALIKGMRVPPDIKVKLPKDHDPGATAGWLKKKDGTPHLELTVRMLAEYQDRLAAQGTYGVLVVLQGIDASGKDGTVRHVMSGVNPQGVTVHSFKEPSAEELEPRLPMADSLRLPERGQIGIFNRSHYEEVVVVRVHPQLLDNERLPPAARGGDIWDRRYREINEWERYLSTTGSGSSSCSSTSPARSSASDSSSASTAPTRTGSSPPPTPPSAPTGTTTSGRSPRCSRHTSTEQAPWWVIPADHKWFARIAVGAVIVSTLVELDPQYPTVSPQAHQELLDARAQLEAEDASGD